MAVKIYITFISLSILFQFGYLCFISTEKIRTCGTPVEVSAEGNAEWKQIYIYHDTIRLNLKKNVFKKTTNIEDLTLFHLDSIDPEALKELTKLDKLSITTSNIEEIPPGLLDSLPLRHLQIIDTKLKVLQQGFFKNMTEIRIVDVRNNNITEIENGIFENTGIYKLYLDSNGINKIADKAFENMDDLFLLSLFGNNLQTFETEKYLGNSSSLSQLLLTKNKLTEITKNTVKTLPNLSHLYLEINQITHIEDGAFSNNPNLAYLDLSNNKLQIIHSNIFPVTGMKELFYIALQNNRLTYINRALFIRVPNLEYITYGGNPLQCPCNKQIEQVLKDNNITRICDDDYSTGDRPSCLNNSYLPNECLYDNELTVDLYAAFKKASEKYPKLQLKCDTTDGLTNAFLNDEELV